MSSCPSCQQTIEIKSQHMGALFTCPHCRAVFFIGWDGQPEGIVEHEPEPAAPQPAAPEPAEAFDAPPISSEYVPAESPLEMPSISQDFAASPDPAFSPLEGIPSGEAEAEAPISNFPENPPMEEEVFTPAGQESFTPETSPDFETPAAGSEDGTISDSFVGGEAFAATGVAAASGGFGDVEAYANQESLSGPLTYTITVKGLELAETFERLREALTDSRFNWEADEIMAKVKGGRLEMTGLNPTKASILINRIKYLPIEVSWKQEVYGGTS